VGLDGRVLWLMEKLGGWEGEGIGLTGREAAFVLY
jgi:hypothetical protein